MRQIGFQPAAEGEGAEGEGGVGEEEEGVEENPRRDARRVWRGSEPCRRKMDASGRRAERTSTFSPDGFFGFELSSLSASSSSPSCSLLALALALPLPFLLLGLPLP